MYDQLYRMPPTDSSIAVLERARELREERDKLAGLLLQFLEIVSNEWYLTPAERQLLDEAEAALSGMDAT